MSLFVKIVLMFASVVGLGYFAVGLKMIKEFKSSSVAYILIGTGLFSTATLVIQPIQMDWLDTTFAVVLPFSLCCIAVVYAMMDNNSEAKTSTYFGVGFYMATAFIAAMVSTSPEYRNAAPPNTDANVYLGIMESIIGSLNPIMAIVLFVVSYRSKHSAFFGKQMRALCIAFAIATFLYQIPGFIGESTKISFMSATILYALNYLYDKTVQSFTIAKRIGNIAITVSTVTTLFLIIRLVIITYF
jgi:hypothetical protein